MEYRTAKFNARRGHITIPRDAIQFPDNCSICLSASTNVIAIEGSGHKLSDLILALLSAIRHITLPVVVCDSCLRRERRRTVLAGIGTVAGFVVGGGLMVAAEYENAAMLLTGLAVLVLSPIAAAAYTALKNKRPVVWNYDDTEVEIKFRNAEYLGLYRDWCQSVGWDAQDV